MTPDRQTAQALADSFTQAEIEDYRLNALKVTMEGGTITRSYEGSSFTIDLNNCAQIIANANEALVILAATAAAETADLIQEPAGRGVDFRNRICA